MILPVLDDLLVVVHEFGSDPCISPEIVRDLRDTVLLSARAPLLTHAAVHVARTEGSRPVRVHGPHPRPALPRCVQLLTRPLQPSWVKDKEAFIRRGFCLLNGKTGAEAIKFHSIAAQFFPWT